MPQQDMKRKIQTRFGNVAANYRKSAVHSAGIDLDLMVRDSGVSPDSLVLDAGCGAGHTAMAFAPHVRRVIACDFTESMLEQVMTLAHERGIGNVETKLADVEALPYPDGHFDTVASRYSAHHWLRPERALSEFARVLKRDGALIMSDIMASENYALDTFLQSIELLRDPSHVRDYRISEWQAMMTAAGLQSEIIHRFELQLYFGTWTTRMATPAQNADMIVTLFNQASEDIKRGFQLPEQIKGRDFSFYIPGAVLKATLVN